MNPDQRDVFKASVQLEKNGRKVLQAKSKFSVPVYNILPSKVTLKNTNYMPPINDENVYCSSVFKITNKVQPSEFYLSCKVRDKDSRTNRVPFNDLTVNACNALGNVSTLKRPSSIANQQFVALSGSAKSVIKKRTRSKSSTEEKGKNAKRHRRSKSVTEAKDVYEDDVISSLDTAICTVTKKINEPTPAYSTKPETIDLTWLIDDFFRNISSSQSIESKREFAFNISPIKPNVFTTPDTFLTEQLFASKRKPKIKKSYAVKYTRLDDSSVYVGDMCVPEYLEDIFRYSLYLEDRQILEPGFLLRFNPTMEFRTKTTNWMFKVQDVMKLRDNEIYASIYIFDKVLASVSVPLNMYQLVAATSIWIANKMENINSIQASNLLSLCGHAFVQRQIHRMERKILRILHFKLCIAEPSFFVIYALKLLNLDDNELARHCAHFIIDCFALHPEFSSSPGSTISFAAVNIALGTLHKKKSNFFEFIKIFGGVPDLTRIEDMLEKHMTAIKNSGHLCEQLKKKYSNMERMEVFKRM